MLHPHTPWLLLLLLLLGDCPRKQHCLQCLRVDRLAVRLGRCMD